MSDPQQPPSVAIAPLPQEPTSEQFGEREVELLFSNRPLTTGERAAFEEIKSEYRRLAKKLLTFPACDSRKVAIRDLKRSQDAISIALIFGV